MPENLDHPPSPADQPPDPAAAKTAAREARRRLCMSVGLSYLCAGIWTGTLAVALLVWPDHSSGLGRTWVLGMFVAALAADPVIKRYRQRRGIPTAAEDEGSEKMVAPIRPWTTAAVVGLTIAVGLTVLLLPWERLPATICGLVPARSAALAAYALGFALLVAWQFGRTLLWEYLLLATSIASAGMAYLLMPGQEVFWALVILCAGLLPASLALHLRWRRWVRSLPPEEPTP